MTIDKQALRQLAERATKGPWRAFSDIGTETYAIHTRRDKRCGNVIKWAGFDCQKNAKANAEFIAAANPATVLALLDELEAETRYREGAFIACNRWHDKFREADDKLEAAERRIEELEHSETQLINERDAAESALADMYQVATGERPEWSNMFGFADAVDVVEERLATLEANQSQTTPTGIQLITEAIGAHGYIVGCLLQGRPDLALEESRKWVSAFGQAAEIVSAQDADDIKVKGE
ncbi:ead/Ea22-like family protein [Salmonella enterica]|nr:ead/Ea22-like family protein [Salmonella enterica]ECI6121282.1 ead/Ea22-like family protein [Salmonella enterica subsp. enterica]EEJ7567114.1 ead/Ea22-like family protein [Salmonella enterica subsp. salamae]EAX7452524.1 ead/Ea22-like family protein [Salmonella enterica]EAX7461665.1 ead/Ea22-like family protein [Salmonella enterica]